MHGFPDTGAVPLCCVGVWKRDLSSLGPACDCPGRSTFLEGDLSMPYCFQVGADAPGDRMGVAQYVRAVGEELLIQQNRPLTFTRTVVGAG
jgi:hypothetical protein